MRNTKPVLNRIICMLAVLLLTIQPVFCVSDFNTALAQTGVVNTDRLNLRSGPGTDYSAIKVLSTNTYVEILGNTRGNDGHEWFKVSVNGITGYLRSDYVSLNVTYGTADNDFEAYLTRQGFPESYKNSLRGLHQKYPNWVFVADHVGIDWNTAVQEESRIGLNLVYTDNISSWKSSEEGAFDYSANYWPGFDGSVWVAASKEIIEHYMDPRNFLSESYIFQFQKQTYDSGIQNREGLASMVQGTFLSGDVSGKNSGSSGEEYGPGYVNNNSTSGSDSTAGPSSGTGSDNSSRIEFIGPQASAGRLFSLLGGITVYADWKQTEGNWVWLNSDGTRNANGWFWLDGNKDGVSECYYFDANGIMASSTTIDGYQVNSDGQWIVDGKVQRKYSGDASSETGSVTYIDLIMNAAQQSGVSPYVLAAMIIQEQGTQGKSELISGTNSEYYGYYNFYNIAAYEHDGMSAVQAGLKYASESGNGNRPWNTVEKGIVGGAIAYGANYVDNGQDTFYLKKFNVQGNNKYKHQFMTNIIAAAQEGMKLSKAYSDEIKKGALTFKIPVYNNMPESACPLPTGTGNPNDRLRSITVDGFSLYPEISINTFEYELSVNSSVNVINVNGQTVDSNATIEGLGSYTLNSGLNEISIKVTAQNGKSRTYKLKITKSDSGDMPSGAYDSSGGPGVVTGNSGISVSNPGNDPAGNVAEKESNIVIGVGPM